MAKSGYAETCRGLTLIELLVALAVSAILGLVMFITLGFGMRQDVSSADLTQMNDSARGALTLLSRDLESAGFMQSVAQSGCSLTLAYDSQQAQPLQQTLPVWAASQAATLPLQHAPVGYDIGYGSQAVMLTLAPSVPQFVASSPAPVPVVQFGTTQSAQGAGALNSTQLPVLAGSGLQPGDVAYLAVPMAGASVCLRVPIVSLGPTTGQGTQYVMSKPSPLMPPNGYAQYASLIPSSYGTLGNTNLVRSRFIDLGGQPGLDHLEVHQYWIAPPGAMPFPVLQRSTYDAMSDQLLQQQAIAPGAVSLQILFRVVPAGGSVSASTPVWKTWGNVQPGDQLVAAAIALVMRSLHADPGYTAPPTASVPQPYASTRASPPDAFQAYTVSPADIHHRFLVYTTEVWLRNIGTPAASASVPAGSASAPVTTPSAPVPPPSSPGGGSSSGGNGNGNGNGNGGGNGNGNGGDNGNGNGGDNGNGNGNGGDNGGGNGGDNGNGNGNGGDNGGGRNGRGGN